MPPMSACNVNLLAYHNKIVRALSLKSIRLAKSSRRFRATHSRCRHHTPTAAFDFQQRQRFMPQSDRTALFIDGANLYATAKALGFDMDYRRLLKEFQSRGILVRAYYYTAVIEDQEFSSIRPLIDWLDYNGYTVVTKPTKEFLDANGRRKVKGSMDIELAVDAMELAGHVDHIVLFSGDGDFRSLVEAVQRRGVRVTVVSTIASQPPMIADELRRQADVFTDLAELQSRIGRDPAERPSRGV
jgi:uncharacterized LabA/DUF88 family protein